MRAFLGLDRKYVSVSSPALCLADLKRLLAADYYGLALAALNGLALVAMGSRRSLMLLAAVQLTALHVCQLGSRRRSPWPNTCRWLFALLRIDDGMLISRPTLQGGRWSFLGRLVTPVCIHRSRSENLIIRRWDCACPCLP